MAAFSLPGAALGALVVALPVYLPRYYVSRFGLALPAVGLAFMAVRLADVGLDPLIGLVMDRTRTRFGRYKPWLALGAPLLAAAVLGLFLPPAGAGYAWLIGGLLVYYLGYSIHSLSHAAWASAAASPYHERSRVFGAVQATSTLAAAVVPLIPFLSPSGGGVPAMGVFIAACAVLGAGAALARIPETLRPSQGKRLALADYWAMARRGDMRRIIAADFCLQMGPGWMSALYLFYFRDARGFPLGDADKLLMVYILAGVPGAWAMSGLARRLGKHRAQIIACVGYAAGLGALNLLPKASLAFALPFMGLMGFVSVSFYMLDRAMVADVGDAVRLEAGENRAAVLYGLITSTQKVASALAVGLSFSLLGWVGYQAREGAVNTPAAVRGLQLVFLAGPIGFVLLGGACYLGYRLDARRHDEIRAALEARHVRGAE